jgi:outer membrane protein OmpA-like peptidoglycan-associated protein
VIGVIRSFAIGSSVLTTALKVQIQHIAALIESKHFDDVMLRGNATLPVSAANRKLAETRAVVVETYLKQLGVHANFKIQFTVSGLVDFYLSVSALAK